MKLIYTKTEQGLYSGIQGQAVNRMNRNSKTGNYRKKGLKKNKAIVKMATFTKDDILKIVEKLSSAYETPFTIEGHKEKLIEVILKNPELRTTLLKSEEGKREKKYSSVPASVEKMRPQYDSSPQIGPVTPYLNGPQRPIRKIVKFKQIENLSTRKYLLSYKNSKFSEKEKIVNVFYNLFREYNFNKEEDKDLILRQIRKIYPSALYILAINLEPKEFNPSIDHILKAFMTNVFQRGRILVNIQKLKQFIREERATLKHVKGMKAEQRRYSYHNYCDPILFIDYKSIFLAKMYNDTEQRKPKLPEPSKPNSNLVHLRTFNLPVKFPTNTQRGTRIPYLESTRKWKSSGKIIPLQGLKI